MYHKARDSPESRTAIWYIWNTKDEDACYEYTVDAF